MIPIAKPLIGEAEVDAVSSVLRSGMIAQGPKVVEFEEAFARYTGVEHAIAVNSGTAALHVSLLANGIGQGDEVITSSFSFIATGNSILATGARPVFADIRPDTFNIDPDSILEKITPKTRAIMPVHLYGQSADMQAIMEIAEDHDLAVIEDACQAHGAGLNGKRVGSFGTGAFSFYPTKNMTTSEGGMITTDDVQVAEKARMIRAHGSKQRYMHELMGYNYRMTDIAAAIGLVQLGRIEEFNSARQKNASVLSDGLRDLDYITTPVVREGCEHVYHQYTVRTENRDTLADYLKDNGVGCGIYYPIPIHQQPLYRDLSYTDDLPETEKAAGEVLSLPVHPALDEKDIEYIITTIKNWE